MHNLVQRTRNNRINNRQVIWSGYLQDGVPVAMSIEKYLLSVNERMNRNRKNGRKNINFITAFLDEENGNGKIEQSGMG